MKEKNITRHRASEPDQQDDKPSLSPRTHMAEGETGLLQAVLGPRLHPVARTVTCAHTHTHT